MKKKIAFIYASTTGNTEAVIDKVSELFSEAKLEHAKQRSEESSPSFIDDNNLFVLATSTWGHGEINPFFNEILEYIEKNDMTGKGAAFIGLGDKSYEAELFNTGIKTLKAAFLKSGGIEIGSTLIIDGDPFPLLDTKVPYWTKKIITAFNKNEKE